MVLRKLPAAGISLLSFTAAAFTIYIWSTPLPAILLFLLALASAYTAGRGGKPGEDEFSELHDHRPGLAVSGSREGIWDLNTDTGEVFFDDLYYRISGYEPGDFPPLVSEWEKRVHPEDISEILAEFQKCRSGRIDLFSADFRFLNKSGEYRWIRARGEVTERKQDGSALRIRGIHSDVHDFKVMEDDLKRSSEMLQHVIDNIPQYIFWKDLDSVYIGCNRHFAKSAGVEGPAQIIGKTDYDLPWSDEEKELYRDSDRRVIASDEPELNSIETQLRADGQRIAANVHKIPLHDNKGRVVGVLGTYEDITEKKRMEESLIQNEKMLSVGGLAAGMAHEINSPLAGMIQTAEVIRNRLESGESISANVTAAVNSGVSLDSVKNYMELRGIPKMLVSIQESGRRISGIVENMLSFARKTDYCYSSHRLNELLDKTIELASTDYDIKKGWDFKKVEIIRDFDPDLPMIPCEGPKLQQVFFNIIKNGAQAMFESNTESPAISLRTGLDDSKSIIIIEIGNNGPGIDEESRKRIFEPFFTTKPVGVGTGLGLSVSYFIITENHNGEMEIESDGTTGVNFIIRLPLDL